MPIFNLYSKQQKKIRGEVPDVFTYGELPNPFRVQVVHIIRDAIGQGQFNNHTEEEAYKFIHNALCREYGLFRLVPSGDTYEASVFNFFLKVENIEQALDVIQSCFIFIDKVVRSSVRHVSSVKINLEPDEAIIELNYRFKENGIGYQYEAGQIIRIDSEYTHTEIIKPTLHLLASDIYKGANQEFLKAHEHYRHRRYQETLVDSLKAFESVMKIICDKHRWKYDSGDTAKKLIERCLENGLIPEYLQSQFSSLRGILESGIPTVRNKLGGHGQGNQQVNVSEEMARYALNLTATNIIFLIEHEQLLSSR